MDFNHQKIRVNQNHELHLISAQAEKPRAKLLLIHGYAEHAGRYAYFMEAAVNRGVSVYAFDLRGHGRSDGLTAYLPSFNAIVEDIDKVIDTLNIKGETFLMGHSLGGLIATRYCLTRNQNDVKGLITSGAALEIDKNLSPLLQRLAPILGWLLPKLKTEKLDTTYLTRSPEVKEAYFNDPLVYTQGTRAKTGAEILHAIKATAPLFHKLTIPLLALHGSADQLTMPDGTITLHKQASSKDKKLVIYDGLYHELVNEPERDLVINDILTWILDRA